MTTKESVIELLKSYTFKKRQIEQLKYELNNPPRISDDTIINSLALGSSLSPSAPIYTNGHISDKTMMIALKYREESSDMMSEAVVQIAKELACLEEEVDRLEHYLKIMDSQNIEIIKSYYFEGQLITKIARDLGVGRGTVKNKISAAVDALTTLYENYNRISNKI